MNILYYHWNENSSQDIEQAFSNLGYSYTKVSYPLSNYDSDSVFETQMYEILSAQCLDCIYTFDYFLILSNIAEMHQIPYIAWVYDCPHLTLYSYTIRNSCNYLFLFDKTMLDTVTSLGAKHAFHMPLVVNTKRINRQLNLSEQETLTSFGSDISFVGSLYENNLYNQIQYLPEALKGYFDGIMQAQQKIWGYNFIEELLTEDILAETLAYLKFEDNPAYSFSAKTLLTNMLNKKITSSERIQLLNRVAEFYPLDIYTGSNSDIIKNGRTHGAISYSDTMPSIFHRSKINLNISLRSITSGVPLRCLDILGCNGFLLSNYQPELVNLFVPGEDFAYFESEEDLLDKIDYYLNHESEHIEIAHNGWRKIQQNFSYESLLTKIFSQVCFSKHSDSDEEIKWNTKKDFRDIHQTYFYDKISKSLETSEYDKLLTLLGNTEFCENFSPQTDIATLIIAGQIYKIEKQNNEPNTIFTNRITKENIVSYMQQIKFFIWKITYAKDDDAIPLFMKFLDEHKTSIHCLQSLLEISGVDSASFYQQILAYQEGYISHE